MADLYVENAQKWLNETYGQDSRYNIIEVNGKTGWTTIYALTRALQIELGIQATADNFGPTTISKFNAKYPNGIHQQGDDDESSDNIYGIIQGALSCKGYDFGANHPTCHFYDGTGSAIKKLKSDAGSSDTSSNVTLNIMKALLSMDAFVRVYNGDEKIREIQQYLNKNYEEYIGLMPCDGLYGRSTNKALIFALQACEGLNVDQATGNFGTTTKKCCPTIPYQQLEKNYSNRIYTELEIEEFIKILQCGLYCNGHKEVVLNGKFDTNTKYGLLEFQKNMALETTVVCNLSTWLSLFLSCGDTERNCVAGDTRFELTKDRLQYLKSKGIKYIGRYLTGGDFKELRIGEPSRIVAEEIAVIPIFQESGTDLTYFTEERAKSDAKKAYNSAKKHEFPKGTTIYFAVDTDPQDWEISSYILPYFKTIRNEFLYNYESFYKVGIYSTRNACQRVISNGFATFAYVSDMSTGYSGNMGFKIPERWAFDQFKEITNIASSDGNWDLDKVAFSGKDEGVSKLDTSYRDYDIYLDLLRQKLFQIYVYAKDYAKSKGKDLTIQEANDYVLQYLRYDGYSSRIWQIIAGNIDEEFIKYVETNRNDDTKQDNIMIPLKKYPYMHIQHLAATLSGNLNKADLNALAEILLTIFVDGYPSIFPPGFPNIADELKDEIIDELMDLAGWAADLVQMGGFVCKNSIEEQPDSDELYSLIGCDDNSLFFHIFGKDDIEISTTGFNYEDLESDIDAVNLAKYLKDGEFPIYDLFYDYYSNISGKYDNRLNIFLGSFINNNFSNKDQLKEKVYNKAKEYTDIKNIGSVVLLVTILQDFKDSYDSGRISENLAEAFANKMVKMAEIDKIL